MALTVRGTLDGLAGVEDTARPALARAVTRAALMGARGNSGVILSQIVRGAADVLGEDVPVDARVVAQALRAASDMAYRGVKRPVEGTMLTVVREMAEEAEARSAAEPEVADLLHTVLARGESALARTPELLSVLKDAGVVDAGGAGLVELMRGIVAAITGEPLPDHLPQWSSASGRPPGALAVSLLPPSSSRVMGSTAMRSSARSRSSATRCSWWETTPR
jgi:dihydroxyacetone kinase-like predicted kinase